MRNKYKERQNIDDNMTKNKNSGVEFNNEKYVEAPVAHGKKLTDNSIIPRNDNVEDIVYAHEINEGHHSMTHSPTYHIEENETEAPASVSYFKFALPYGISATYNNQDSITVYDKIHVDDEKLVPVIDDVKLQGAIDPSSSGIDSDNNNADLYSNTYYNQVVNNELIEERVSRGNVKDIPTSYVIQTYEKENSLPTYENNSSRNPFSTFQNEFGNFKVGLNEENGKIEGEIGSPIDINYENKENEEILGYKGAIWKASNLPYNDIDKVPIITPTHTSLYHKPSLASDTSYKREIGITQRLQHPTLYREQFESKIIASSTFKRFQ